VRLRHKGRKGLAGCLNCVRAYKYFNYTTWFFVSAGYARERNTAGHAAHPLCLHPWWQSWVLCWGPPLGRKAFPREADQPSPGKVATAYASPEKPAKADLPRGGSLGFCAGGPGQPQEPRLAACMHRGAFRGGAFCDIWHVAAVAVHVLQRCKSGNW
jgi:hypothetical protein